MHKWISRLAGLFAALLLAQPALADLPHGTLQFITPNVTVGANDTVQLWVRFTLDANSPAFNFSSYPLMGISAADLSPEGYHYDPATGSYSYANFAQIDSVTISAGMLGCCSSAIYANYGFSFGAPTIGQDHFNLAPGQSFDFVFAQLTPTAGGAAAGTYSANLAELTLNYTGVDSNGNWLAAVNRPVIGSTCSDLSNASCSFTFTVAVPEPSSYAMLGLGLLAIGYVARKRALKTARSA